MGGGGVYGGGESLRLDGWGEVGGGGEVGGEGDGVNAG